MATYGFGSGLLWGTPLTDNTGAAVANPTPVLFGALQDASLDFSFDSKMLSGQNSFPLAVGRGKGKITGKAKFGQISGALVSSLFFGSGSTSSILQNNYDTTGILIPATPFTITASTSLTLTTIPIPSSGTWAADLGVRNANNVSMTRVASGPTTGQYTVAAGVYVFATADAGLQVFIDFAYTATSTVAKKIAINNVVMGAAPTFRCDFSNNYQGKFQTVSLFACISSKLSISTKNDDFLIPEFDFDAFANAAGQIGTLALAE